MPPTIRAGAGPIIGYGLGNIVVGENALLYSVYVTDTYVRGIWSGSERIWSIKSRITFEHN